MGKTIEKPLPAGAAHAMGMVAATLVGAGGPEYSAKPRPVDEPINTVMTQSRQSLATAFISQYFGDTGQPPGKPADEPLPTVTAVDHNAVVASHLIHMNHGAKQWSGMDEPLRTITSGNHAGEVRAFLIKYFGSGCGQEISDPLHTITKRDRFGLVTIDGQDFQIIDIGLRMLSPAELLRAQFGKYAKGYILLGTKAQQVAKIGNSVPPELAEAVVRANFADEIEVAA